MQKVKLSDIRPNPNNPRVIKDDKFKKLVQSIQDFPQMLELRPIVVNDEMIVLGGNMRLKALEHLGIEETFIIKAGDLTDKQEQEFIIKDNVGYGEWDWEQLANEWDVEDLDDWGLTIPNWSAGLDVNNMNENDIDIDEEFNPMGNMDGKQRVVFLFDGAEEAESYLNSLHVTFVKRNMAWQVDLSTQSI